MQNIAFIFEILVCIIGIGTLVFNTGVLSNKVKTNTERILLLEEKIDRDIKDLRDKQNQDIKDIREKVDEMYEIIVNNLR